MKKEEIIVSFETAKKLKEAGRNKECVFKWEDGLVQGEGVDFPPFITEEKIGSITELYQAPTSEEIIEELPWLIEEVGQDDCYITFTRFYDTFVIEYIDQYRGVIIESTHNDKSLSEASAKMWLWLKENKHL